MKDKKIMKRGLAVLAAAFAACLFLMLFCNFLVCRNAKGKVFDEVHSLEETETGLLLGTTPQTRIGRKQNMFFTYRLDAACQLYEAGKIHQILISGDANSLDGVNEPECMRDSLVARGIPEDDIILDGKGYRTLDSVVRLCKVFGARSFIIISQQFHNERALYLAEHLGLGVGHVQAYNARSPHSAMSLMTYAREYLARVKMFLDLMTGKQPEDMDRGYLPDEELLEEIIAEDPNTIVAHDERDTIIGNFTGEGMDTLFVMHEENPAFGKGDDMRNIWYMASTNPKIPKQMLFGYDLVPPCLVNEGDLDGNGTSEVGYLHTWMMSQWRQYRIFSLVDGQWRYLVYGDYMDTPEWFRYSGVEVAEPGKEKGTVLIHYAFDGWDEKTESQVQEIRDTIVKPTFTIIDD